jgi:hypothetical protein
VLDYDSVKGHQKKDPSWVTKEPGLVGGFFIMVSLTANWFIGYFD